MIDDDGDPVPPEELGPEAIQRGVIPREELEQKVEGLVAEFPHFRRDELLILLAKLEKMPDFYRSQPSLERERWFVPKDLPNWKQTRAKLDQLEGALDKAVDLMRDGVAGDPAFRIALANAAPQVGLSDHYIALLTLHGAARSAAAVDGRAGNRPLPMWTENAANLCAFFWTERSDTPATPYFTYDENTLPANDFSTWFCRVMEAIDPRLTPSTCETILRTNRARIRPD